MQNKSDSNQLRINLVANGFYVETFYATSEETTLNITNQQIGLDKAHMHNLIDEWLEMIGYKE